MKNNAKQQSKSAQLSNEDAQAMLNELEDQYNALLAAFNDLMKEGYANCASHAEDDLDPVLKQQLDKLLGDLQKTHEMRLLYMQKVHEKRVLDMEKEQAKEIQKLKTKVEFAEKAAAILSKYTVDNK